MKSFSDLYEKLVNVVQRKKMARRMAKLAKSPAFQFKKKKALLKMRSPAKIHQAARKKTIQMFRDKFYKSYKSMSLQQKVKVDQLIMAKYGSKIDKISKKMAMKLRKQEMERIKKARAIKKDA
jgi:hypothetical protein